MKKKVVLYIDTMYRGGAQRVMSVLAEYLVNSDYDVLLINDFESNVKSNEYRLSPKIHRVYLQKENKGNIVIKNIKRINELRRIIRMEKPDTVLSFLGRPNFRMLLSTIGIKSRKIVSVRNDPNKEYGSSFIKKVITNLIFLLADGYVFQTPDARKYFIKKIQNNSKIIFNPVDEKFYNTKIVENKKNIITVGRLEKQKNQKLLLDAFELITKEFPNENLIIYGEGTLEKELKDCAMKKNIFEKVFFKGNVSNVENELSKAKIFVLSSDYEGMPNALMEAMASGIACVSTDCPCGGPRLLIENDEQGILVPCNDSKKLSNAIKNVLNSDYNRIGKNAKIRAMCFKTQTIMKQWEDYLFY